MIPGGPGAWAWGVRGLRSGYPCPSSQFSVFRIQRSSPIPYNTPVTQGLPHPRPGTPREHAAAGNLLYDAVNRFTCDAPAHPRGQGADAVAANTGSSAPPTDSAWTPPSAPGTNQPDTVSSLGQTRRGRAIPADRTGSHPPAVPVPDDPPLRREPGHRREYPSAEPAVLPPDRSPTGMNQRADESEDQLISESVHR